MATVAPLIDLYLSIDEELLKGRAVVDRKDNLIILEEGGIAITFTAYYENVALDEAKAKQEELGRQQSKLANELHDDQLALKREERMLDECAVALGKNNSEKSRSNYERQQKMYNKKVADYKKKYDRYKAIDKRYQEQQQEVGRLLKTQQELLMKVKWLWHLRSRNKLLTKAHYRKDLETIGHIQQFGLSRLYEGGGMAWVEAFVADGDPKVKPPYGFLVAAKGKPAILKTIWREYRKDNDGAIINGQQKKFKEAVQLHIYTRALYGQDLDIELYDDRWRTETLPPFELSGVDRAKHEKEEKTPIASDAYFRREVKVYPLLDDEKAFMDSIITGDNEVSTGKQLLVQKCVVDVYLDELWRFSGGESLKVYAIVRSRPADFMDKYANTGEYINVEQISDMLSPFMMSNTVVEVGEIDVDAGSFRPCRYAGITVTVGDKPTQTIFSENVLMVDFVAQRTFNIVAGSGKAKEAVTLKVDGLSTKADDCLSPAQHAGRVIDLVPATTWGEGGYALAPPGTSVLRKPEQPKSLKRKTSWSILGYTSTADSKMSSATNIVVHDDEHLVFDATYQYTLKKDDKIDWQRLWGYVWLPSVQVDTYSVAVQSCAWMHHVDFVVYPDIKWTVGFKIDFDGEKFKKFEADFETHNGRTTLNPFKKAYLYVADMNRRFSAGDYSRENLEAFRRSDRRLQSNSRNTHNRDGLRRINPAAAHDSSAFDKVLKVLDEYEISLKAEWNNAADKVDVIDTIFQTIEGAVLGFKTAVGFIKAVLDGELTKQVNMSEVKRSELVRRFTKPPVDYSIKPPSLAVAAAWYYETMPPVDKSSLTWGAGITWAIQLSMAPLIGIDIRMDLFQMLSRKHPVAMAAYAASALLQTLLDQDKPVIEVALIISGEITLEGNFKHNTIGGNVVSRGGKSAVKEELVKGGANISVSLEVRMHGELKVDFFYVTTVKGYIDAGVKGTASFGVETLLGSDELGMYWENVLKFNGMQLKGNFTVDVEARSNDEKRKKDKQPLFDTNFEVGLNATSFSFGKCRF